MDKPRQRRSSGPRSFDRKQAVETAMYLFWRRGYEGVSIADLTSAIGIAPPSLYAAFGNKAGLYREALDRYADLPGGLDGMATAPSLEQAVAGLFDASIRAVTAEPRGCMVSTGLVECAVEHDELARELAARRLTIRARMVDSLCRWVDPTRAGPLAAYLAAVQQGIALQARDGATREELGVIAAEALAGIRAQQHALQVAGSKHHGSADPA